MWRWRAPPKRLYHCRYRKWVKPTTAKEGCERAKQTERNKKRLSLEKVAAGWQRLHKVASSTTCTPHTSTHTANAFTALKAEEATPIQFERRLEELAWPVTHTSRTSRRKSRFAKKEALTGKLSARLEPTQSADLSERRELTQTEELSARWELPTYAAQNLARPHRSSYFLPKMGAGQTKLYLVDAGCNTNLVSKLIASKLTDYLVSSEEYSAEPLFGKGFQQH